MIAVRPARPDDVGALVAVEEAAFDPALYAGTTMSRRSFVAHVAAGRHGLFVATDDPAGDHVIGYALGFVKRGSPYVRFVSLAVLPEQNGRGAGGLLFRAIEAFARATGRRGVRLEVRADNQRLLARYAGFGYRVFDTVPDYYGDGCAAVRLVKDV